MAVEELVTIPLFSISRSGGLAASRRWACDVIDEAMQLAKDIAANPFPLPVTDFNLSASKDFLPVAVTIGPFSEGMAPGSTSGSVNTLPTYEKYLVAAQYQLLNDAGVEQWGSWPQWMDKPCHPVGTSLSCRIRNSGQFITMPAATVGEVVNDAGVKVCNMTANMSLVQLIPIREFHISCDLLQDYQVPQMELFTGRVNESTFLGADPETLLCESADTDHSFAADIENPCRFRVNVVLRERTITRSAGSNVGWNHEYHNVNDDGGNGPGWYRIKLTDGSNRYSLVDMTEMFGIADTAD